MSVQPAGGGRVLGRFTFLNCLVRRESVLDMAATAVTY